MEIKMSADFNKCSKYLQHCKISWGPLARAVICQTAHQVPGRLKHLEE